MKRFWCVFITVFVWRLSYLNIATCCFTLYCFCSVWFECISLLFCGNLLGNRKKLLTVPLVFILFLWWELFDSTYYSDQFWFVSFALCLRKLDFFSSNGWLTKFAQVTKHTSTKTGKHLKLMPQRMVSMFFLLPILKYQFIQAYSIILVMILSVFVFCGC